MRTVFNLIAIIFACSLLIFACNNMEHTKATEAETTTKALAVEKPEYFLLRPEVEKAYGYSLTGVYDQDRTGSV